MTSRPILVVLMKYPAPGRVKTRLAGVIGPERAAALYRDWIGLVLERLQPLRPQLRLAGFYAGASFEGFRAWHALADDWWPQPEGGLGERLAAGFAIGFQVGAPVLAIGTDCLDIDARLVERACAALISNDVVLGPTLDGGYYLVGMQKFCRSLFQSVRWSSSQTLSDQLGRCAVLGCGVDLLPSLHDIDTWDDWQAYLVRRAE